MTTTTRAPAARPATGETTVELAVSGMTCASCANRIERKLNKLDGVQASVNYATEKAHVTYPDALPLEQVLQAVTEAGYTAHPPATASATAPKERSELTALRDRTVVSAALSVPVVLLAMIPALQFDAWQWLSLTLASPVVVWGGLPFHRAAWSNARHGAATMDTLVSLGTLAAYAWSVYALFFGTAGHLGMTHGLSLTASGSDGSGTIYLETAAGVTTFLLAGRYLEMRAKRRSGAALQALLELGAKDVTVLRDSTESRIPVAGLRVGDRFVVRPGEKVATDGQVVDGRSAVDASLLTGESVPVDVGPGDTVAGATVNTSGRLVLQALRVGSDTQLAQIARLVEQAQSGKAQVQRLADRISGVFVPAVLVLALLTLAGWLLTGHSPTSAFTASVAVLVIACPCALGLATPTALLVGTGRGAQLGILIKGPEVLESTRRVDTIVLDKTGTVTTGQMALLDLTVTSDQDPDGVLTLVGAVEAGSEHPIGRALTAGAEERVGPLPAVEAFRNLEGLGVEGAVHGRRVHVGRPAPGRQLPHPLEAALLAAGGHGQTAVLASVDDQPVAVLTVADAVKPTSAAALDRLRQLGLDPWLLTGDNRAVATSVADEVRIPTDHVLAEVLPAGKADTIRQLQAQGRVVAMVGDGVNDAAALAQADLGISLGTGTDAAIEASDLTLVRGDLQLAADAIRLSRRTLTIIKGNLFWAFAYNLAALPLAVAGLLTPMLAGAAMALSSVFVVTNSLRLRTFRADAS